MISITYSRAGARRYRGTAIEKSRSSENYGQILSSTHPAGTFSSSSHCPARTEPNSLSGSQQSGHVV